MSFPFADFIDILGIFSFAVSGAFAAMEKKLDPFGVPILAFSTAIGGGTVPNEVAAAISIILIFATCMPGIRYRWHLPIWYQSK